MIAQIKIRRGTTAEWAAASPVVLAEGEPGWDTTLKGMKVGDGATEWAELPWIDAKNRPDINADLLDGNHASAFAPAVHTHPFTNHNLLHNWDFRNPVNQRGVSGAISTGTYFFDRWIRNSGTVTVEDGYLTLASGAVIEQRIEGNLLAGEIVTVSVEVGGVVYSGTGTMPSSEGTASVTITGFGTATLGYATGYCYVRLSPTAAVNAQRCKIEVGNVSTLAYDPPMEYGTELTKCERFYIGFGPERYMLALADGPTAARGFIHKTMRVAPTVTFSMLMLFTNAVKPVTAISAEKTFGGVSILITSSGLTAFQVYRLQHEDVTGRFALSADL